MKLGQRRYSLFLTVVTVSTITLAIAAQDRPAPRVTASGLARDLAAAARSANAPEVSRLLEQIDLGARPEAPLSEGGAAAILRSLGIATTTATPGRLLTQEKAAALVRSFQASVLAQTLRPGVTQRRIAAPATFEDCFQEKNHGTCVECCKALGGGASSCAKECFVINKPSPGEPLP